MTKKEPIGEWFNELDIRKCPQCCVRMKIVETPKGRYCFCRNEKCEVACITMLDNFKVESE